MAKCHRCGWLVGVSLVALTIPIEVGAHATPTKEPARSFLELRDRLQPGDGVFVVDTGGKRVRGFVEGLSDSSLTLLVGNDRRLFGETEVASVQRVHDSLRNGIVIGALVGAGVFGLATSQWGPEIAGPWALVGAGIGAGAGLAIDAARWKGPTLYRKVAGKAQFVPEVFSGRRALYLSFAF